MTILVAAVAACILDKAGYVLLLQCSYGDELWGFPGGAIEPHEWADEAIARGVYEYIGLELKPVALIIKQEVG